MHKRDLIAVGSWIGVALSLWVIAWIISAAIPVFSNLLSLMVRFISLDNNYSSVLINLDGLIRKLVQLRPSRDLLAIP